MSTLLTQHFSLEELTTTDILELKQKNFEEGRKFIPELCKTANLLECVRKVIQSPMIITSGYRCAELNAHPKIKGSPTSQHCFGEAADFIPTKISAQDAAALIRQSDIQYGQLILEKRGQGHIVHISQGNKRENLYSPKAGVYETVPLF